MPRATRKSLADASSPARSSPRAYTKASTAAAGTSSPAKSPGRRGKADEEPEAEMVTESKTRGRSSSRGGGVQTPSPAHSGGSRSRGKSSTPTTMEKKTPPSSGKQGHGKTQKDKEPDEDEDKEQKEEVKKTPTSGRRGRGIAIKDEEPKEKKKESVKKIPPATSRRSRGKAEKEEEPEENDKDQEKANKDEKKILPVSGRRSHGRAGKNEEEEEEAVSTEEVKKTSPASGRRGRGKAKKDEEHKEEENEESKKEEAKKTLQASGRRGRGQAKKDELTGEEDEVEKEGKKTEASGRRGRGKAAKEEEAHEEKADKEEDKLFEKTPTSVRRGRGKDKKDEELEDKDKQMEEKKTPTSDRRGGRERAKQDEPEEKEATEAEEKMDVDEEEKEEELTPKRGGGQSKGGHKISEEQTTSPPKTARASRRSAGDVDVEEKESTSPLSHGRGKGRPLSARVKPTASQSSDGGDASQSANCGNAAETKDKEPEVEKFAEEANKQAEKLSVEQMDSKSEEAEIETEKEAEVSEEKETEKPDKKKATETQAKESEKATEKMEWHAKAKPAEEEVLSPMEEKATPTAEKESRNSETDAVSPRTKSSVKRKLEDEPVEESESCAVKKARLNGTEPADVEMVDPDAVATQIEVSDAEVLKSYVMVNMEELPAADSAEVAAAVPPPHTQEAEEEQPTATDKVMETDKVSLPCFLEPMVVPLTEAEVAKAYAKEIQGSKGESDDVSSVIVEVGSISGSETFSGLSARGLDTSELQSGSNSIDDDDAADTSVNESALRGSDSELIYPGVKQEVSASIPEPPVTDEAAAVSQLPVSGESSVQAVQHTPTKPVSKGSSSVSPSLGTPDPTFLATYSSPDIFTRAYVPNPAASTKPGVPANNFSIVSYNILAECHRLNSDYSYTPVEYLGLEYRHALLLRELEYLNGDIVCLQEVNPNYFTTTLQPQMKSIGYDGLMKCRTKGVDEGEATFYKCDRFVLEASKEVSLGEAAHKEAAAGGLTPEVGDAVHKYLDRADVILITKLRCKNSGKVVTVGNIHIVYDNLKSPDIQCIQAACAIKEVVSVAGGDGAHIICGDFNSEWSSPVYQLVVDGYLSDSSIHALQAVQRLELDDGAKSLVNHLWRAFQHTSSNLRSAYSTVTKSEPEVTTFTTSMKNAVDYIFYSAGCLIPVGILKTINRSVIDDSDGLPNKYIPSDHLSLKAVISFSK